MTKPLWAPSEQRIKQSNMFRFLNIVNERFDKNFREYAALYEWSTENIAEFWSTFWDFADIIATKPYDNVVDDLRKMPGARWFSGSRLNFAQNLLRYRDDRVGGPVADDVRKEGLRDDLHRLGQTVEQRVCRKRRLARIERHLQSIADKLAKEI